MWLGFPLQIPQNWACCDTQSWLGSRSQWSSPLASPAGASSVQWSVFWVPRALPPLTFIVSYAKSMGHSVWTSKTCESGSESSCMDVQTSMTNSILVGLRFWPKQLQKWSKNKKCLNNGMWQFVSCANVSLKSVWVRLAMWWDSSMTRVYEKFHSACNRAPIARWLCQKIAESPAFPSM